MNKTNNKIETNDLSFINHSMMLGKAFIITIMIVVLFACEKKNQENEVKKPTQIVGLSKSDKLKLLNQGNSPKSIPKSIPSFLPADVAAGKELVRQNCQRCHMLPEPIWLDKKTWYHSVMPNMSVRLGRFSVNDSSYDYIPKEWFEKGEAGERVKRENVFPSSPLVTNKEWQQMVAYYTSEAPEQPSLIKPRLNINNTDFPFKPHKLPVSISPSISLVKMSLRKNEIYVGEAASNTLKILDVPKNEFQHFSLKSPPVHIVELSKKNFIVTTIGSIPATDNYLGQVVFFNHNPDTKETSAKLLLDSLGRPVHTSVAKLKGDRLSDLVVSGFGNWTGSLGIFEKKSDAGFKEHKIKNLPGSLQNYVTDFDKDGLLDIVMLKAHGDEGVYLFKNMGQDEYREQRLIRFPPTYGSNYMELVDFNNDGFLDVLMTNGDNADYVPILKDYHGIRIFLNQKDGTLKEDKFFPLHGAIKAQAFDYDGDGDLDIAAIAFFLDFEGGQNAGFVLLNNRGDGNYTAHSFEESNSGRWMIMDSGDLDQDGDIDIILGAHNMEADLPDEVALRWRKNTVPLLLLENLTIK